MVLFLKKAAYAVMLLPVMMLAAVIVENGKCDYDIVIREGAPLR